MGQEEACEQNPLDRSLGAAPRRGAAGRCPRGSPMASLVQRRDKRADINNRRQYLQLFACQRAAPLYRWWYALNIETKHDLLKSWGIPERPINDPNPRFPAHFHVDELLKADDQAPVTQPPLYAPLDGVLRTFAIVADPLTRWAPRVSDESVDWLDTLTAICEALADEYVCLLYTSPSPRDQRGSRMPSSA